MDILPTIQQYTSNAYNTVKDKFTSPDNTKSSKYWFDKIKEYNAKLTKARAALTRAKIKESLEKRKKYSKYIRRS